MDYPIVLLNSWVLGLVTGCIRDQSIYSTNLLVKNFIKFESPTCTNLNVTPLLRVFAFTKLTDSGEISAVLHDSSHKILVLFTKECIERFESRYGQRITYHTVHSLFLVKQANLRFLTLFQLRLKFGVVGGLRISPKVALVYLEISDVDFFQRDQIWVSPLAEKMLHYVYGDVEYEKKYSQQNVSPQGIADFVLENDDGLISDEESLPLLVKTGF